MTLRESIFELWAPTGAAWTDWAKPVLFSHLPTIQSAPTAPRDAPPLPNVAWAPPADGSAAIVVELPGPASVMTGVALAHVGYRPVPLFNAVPGPASTGLPNAPGAVVDVWSIAQAVVDASESLRAASSRLPIDAPPAFLLDSGRRFARWTPRPLDFDNRSISLPTDFPSANLLLSRNVRHAVLVRMAGTTQPQEDLAHTLRRWQDAGIAIDPCDLSAIPHPTITALRVSRPLWYRTMWSNALAMIGLRRHPLGGFGGMLPEPSSG